MSRLTKKQAEAALFDYRISPHAALKLYRRARGSRFGNVNDHFLLHCAGVLRRAAEEAAALAEWETEGGA